MNKINEIKKLLPIDIEEDLLISAILALPATTPLNIFIPFINSYIITQLLNVYFIKVM